MNRRAVLRLLAGGLAGAVLAQRRCARPARRAAYDFWFTRLKYDSGDWDVDQRMPANLLDSLIEYTTLRVDPEERVVAAGRSARCCDAPFCYLAGHKLVEFNAGRARNFERYVRNGGFVFVDDCNHDIDGLFAKSFEAQMAAIFGADALTKLPNNHPLYRSFFTFDGPPTTAFELNGWGDDLVHDYLQGHRDRRPPRRALQQQGLRLRVGLRLAQQALAGRGQHEVRGQHRRVCTDA